MPPRGKQRRSAAIIRSMDPGFPPKGSKRSWEIHLSDAFETYKTLPSPTLAIDRSLRFSPRSSIPRLQLADTSRGTSPTTSGRRRRPLCSHHPHQREPHRHHLRPNPTRTVTPLAGEGRHRKMERQGPTDHLLSWPRRHRRQIFRHRVAPAASRH
jgi:hypothetical protein